MVKGDAGRCWEGIKARRTTQSLFSPVRMNSAGRKWLFKFVVSYFCYSYSEVSCPQDKTLEVKTLIMTGKGV